jgi:DNA invertase Pin-like site-specific DNA recombinase
MSTPDRVCTAGPDRRRSTAQLPLAEAPASPNRPTKIQPWHLERLAAVYVRQSSPYQVSNNKESAEVQASFRKVAVAWGWPDSRIVLIDEDQARSATSAEERAGFQRLLTEVNLNHVGIIFGFQVSRLSRANADWYHLLDRCAIFHTLLADLDGIYDPTQYNDRLLLGLKGTMSEAELHLLRQRLYQGRLNKARRGEQFVSAPVGYVLAPSGNRLELDSDEQVQHVVRLIFDKFDELGSAGAVLRYLVRNDIKLGFRVQSGPDAGQLRWRPAIRPTLNRILRHPYYGGCYVFGLTRGDARRKKPGRPGSGRVQVERLKWDVMLPGTIPAYITWERYLANQERLAANRYLPTTPGASRSGPSLLSGLVYCARCGKRMRVAYHAKGTHVYYLCNSGYVERAEPVCQSLGGKSLEVLVAEEVLLAIKPARLELSAQAIADVRRERERLDEHWQQRLERARTETNRAARQYHAVEPENRLVARELERRWEQALKDQRGLEEEHDRFLANQPRELTAADRRRIEALARDIPALWRAASTTVQDRQEIVRCLVERITVGVRGKTEWVDVTIRWAGGQESRHEIRRVVTKYEQLSNYGTLRDRVIELRRNGATTEEIAERLNAEGFYPPRGQANFNRHVVNQFLVRQRLLGPGVNHRIKPEDLQHHEWRLKDLASELKMPAITLRHWHYRGWVHARKSRAVGGCWILWADEAELDRLRRLHAWHRGGYNRDRPPELTTPRIPKTGTQPRRERGAQAATRGRAKGGRNKKTG